MGLEELAGLRKRQIEIIRKDVGDFEYNPNAAKEVKKQRFEEFCERYLNPFLDYSNIFAFLKLTSCAYSLLVIGFFSVKEPESEGLSVSNAVFYYDKVNRRAVYDLVNTHRKDFKVSHRSDCTKLYKLSEEGEDTFYMLLYQLQVPEMENQKP